MAGPVRKCAGCGVKAGKPDFVRVVRFKSGEVIFDPDLKYQGRSLYFCPRKKCFELLERRKAAEKLMMKKIPSEIRDKIRNYLDRPESE